MIDPIGPDYFDLEKNEIAPLLGEAQQDNSE
jgi:hypothetical protein